MDKTELNEKTFELISKLHPDIRMRMKSDFISFSSDQAKFHLVAQESLLSIDEQDRKYRIGRTLPSVDKYSRYKTNNRGGHDLSCYGLSITFAPYVETRKGYVLARFEENNKYLLDFLQHFTSKGWKSNFLEIPQQYNKGTISYPANISNSKHCNELRNKWIKKAFIPEYLPEKYVFL